MNHYLILLSLFVFAVSAAVFVFSVVQLVRMRHGKRSIARRRRRSPLSRLRAHLYAEESLREPA